MGRTRPGATPGIPLPRAPTLAAGGSRRRPVTPLLLLRLLLLAMLLAILLLLLAMVPVWVRTQMLGTALPPPPLPPPLPPLLPLLLPLSLWGQWGACWLLAPPGFCLAPVGCLVGVQWDCGLDPGRFLIENGPKQTLPKTKETQSPKLWIILDRF